MSDKTVCFRCPSCTTKLEVPSDLAMSRYLCPFCLQKVTVPDSSSLDADKADPSSLYNFEDENSLTGTDGKIHRKEYTSVLCPRCKTVIAVEKESKEELVVCPDCEKKIVIKDNLLEEHRRELSSGTIAPQVQGTYELVSDWKKVRPLPPKKDQFAINCPICGTMQYATTEQIGHLLTCPDCYRQFPVVRPTAVPVPDPEKKVFTYEGTSTYDLAGEKKDNSNQPTEPTVPVVCERCGTRVYKPITLIGQKSQCPDCLHETVITAPTNEQILQKQRIQPRKTGIYGLGMESTPPEIPAENGTMSPVYFGSNPKGTTTRQSGFESDSVTNAGFNSVNKLSNDITKEKGETRKPTVERFGNSVENKSNEYRSLFDPFARTIAPPVKTSDTELQAASEVQTESRQNSDQYSSRATRQQEKKKRKRDRDRRRQDSAGVRDDGLVPVRRGDIVVYAPASPPKFAMFKKPFRLLPDGELVRRAITPVMSALIIISLFYCVVLPSFSGAGQGGPLGVGNAMILVPILALIGFLVECWLWKTAQLILSIVMAGSTGARRVGEWMEEDIVGGIVLAFWLLGVISIAAALAALIPVGLTFLLPDFPVPPKIAFGLTLFFIIFPIIFLSMYQSNGATAFWIVLLSLIRCFFSWICFWILTLIFAGIPCILVTIMKVTPFTMLLVFLGATIVPLFYAALLGRLAWIIDDDLRNREEE